jgi:hypothetical protein
MSFYSSEVRYSIGIFYLYFQTFLFFLSNLLFFPPFFIFAASDLCTYLDGMLEDSLVGGLEGEAEAAVHLLQEDPELAYWLGAAAAAILQSLLHRPQQVCIGGQL